MAHDRFGIITAVESEASKPHLEDADVDVMTDELLCGDSLLCG